MYDTPSFFADISSNAAERAVANLQTPAPLPRTRACFHALQSTQPHPLPVFQKRHHLRNAWRVDPRTLTPWVIVETNTLPTKAEQATIEDALVHASASGAFLLWIFTPQEQERLIIHLGGKNERWVHERRNARPLPHLRELEDALTDPLPYPARLAHAAALLARKDVTHRFYKQIQQSVRMIAEAWIGELPIPGAVRHELSLLLVSRLMFLHFVQAKNWLPTPNYLLEIVRQPAASIFREYLQPLFFDALNLAPDERISGVIPKQIPYLNGGLFAKSDAEKQFPQLDLPNHVLRTLIEDVFHRYAFVDDEYEGHAHAIAPQLLGEIFERLMCPEERQVTGAFYTPHPLATRVWKAALRSHLQATIGQDLTRKLESRAPLRPHEAQTIFDRLWNLRILDPAVGTGAFLLAALIDLEDAARHALSFLPEHTYTRRALREHWVTHSLHGIDIQHNAVLLAELRLWLSVTAVSDNTPEAATPLPNLEHRLRVGNALIAPTWGKITQFSAELQSHLRALSLALASFPTQRGNARHNALETIRVLEQRILHRGIEERLAELVYQRTAQLSLLPKDTAPTPPSAEERALTTLRDEAKAWQQAGTLDPKLHFADVLQEGGFDIIIGNPPWGQISTLDTRTQRELRKRYEVLHGRGGRQSSPDMSVAFFEAYLPLLSAHGRMAFLFPAKTLRARWGASWRAWIQRNAVVETLEELSTHTHHGFHASVYPCVSLLRRRTPQDTACSHPALRTQQHRPALLPSNLRPLETFFTPRYGVKTGCNRAFLLSKDTPLRTARPAVRGKDLRPFSYRCAQKLLCTHALDTADVLQEISDETRAHLLPFYDTLTQRSDLRESMPWWTLFRVRKESLGWRVAWRDVAQRLEAAVLPPVTDGGPINLNSTYAIAVTTEEEARAICAWLNTDVVSEYLTPRAQRARNGYYRFDAGLVRSAPVPHALLETNSALRAHALSLFHGSKAPCATQLTAWNHAARDVFDPRKMDAASRADTT